MFKFIPAKWAGSVSRDVNSVKKNLKWDVLSHEKQADPVKWDLTLLMWDRSKAVRIIFHLIVIQTWTNWFFIFSRKKIEKTLNKCHVMLFLLTQQGWKVTYHSLTSPARWGHVIRPSVRQSLHFFMIFENMLVQ